MNIAIQVDGILFPYGKIGNDWLYGMNCDNCFFDNTKCGLFCERVRKEIKRRKQCYES